MGSNRSVSAAFGKISRIRAIANAVLWSMPLLLGVLYVLAFGVNVPLLDDFGFIEILKRYHSGTLSFADLISPQNEHRLFMPRLIMIPLAVLSGYDLISFMIVIQLIVALCLVLLLVQWHRRFPEGIMPFIAIGFLLFSVRQFENWLFGIQVHYVTQMAFVFLALCMLDAAMRRDGKRRFVFAAAAMIFGLCTSFSNINGLFVWIAGAVVIYAAEKRLSMFRRFISPLLIVWVLCGALAWFLYLNGLESPAHHNAYRASLSDPLRIMIVFLSTCGTSVMPDLIGSIIIGAGSIMLVAFFSIRSFRDRTMADHALWMGFAAYAVCTALAVTFGRAGLSERIGLAPRYGMFTVPLIVAAFSMLYAHRRERVFGVLLVVMQTFIIAGLIYSAIVGIQAGMRWRDRWSENASKLLSYRTLTDAELRTHVQYSINPRADLAFLEAHRYSLFSRKTNCTTLKK